MKKRLFIIIFCAVLLVLVYRAGFDSSDSDADVNDVNGVDTNQGADFNEPREPNDLMVLQSDGAVH